MFLYVFLEKTKLKDVSSNDADWIRDLRIILIATQKNYVLDAPLGDRPIAGADADIMNVWLAQYDDYLIVLCTMLYGLEPWLQKYFECHRAYKMFQELKLVFQTHAHVERYETSDSTLLTRWRRIAQPVSMCSECLGTTIAWIKWELIFQIR